jgi:hypothetical protein
VKGVNAYAGADFKVSQDTPQLSAKWTPEVLHLINGDALAADRGLWGQKSCRSPTATAPTAADT